MSLRAKLLLLSLLTLILPWAGWQYAQQMEITLRQGQETALLTTADLLGRVIASEPELLYRTRGLATDFDPVNGDLFAPLLRTPPLLDGFADEWPVPTRAVPGFSDDRTGPLKIRLGVYKRSMHLFAEVRTASIDYEIPSSAAFSQKPSSDRLIILMRDEFGRERAWSISAIAPGPLIVRPCEVGMPWRPADELVANVSGVWRETAEGYAIELRAPINLFGTHLAVHAIDKHHDFVARSGALATVHTGSEALEQRLHRYAPIGTRVSVIDMHGWLLARAGSVKVDGASEQAGLRRDHDGFSRSVYRVLFSGSDEPVRPYGLPYGMWGRPVDEARAGQQTAVWFEQAGGEPSLIRAAVPIQVDAETFGALVVEQPGERLVLVRELALTRLLNLTLVATLFAIAITVIFSARLSQRIRRLSVAASTALTPEGRIDASIPDTDARDELGALARSYGTLLTRLKEYTSYLQTLGTKLSHELRTPLTIVSSSLDNLASEEKLPDAAQDYLERARGGTARMHAILTAMSEATRVEQSIEHTERVRFDLADLVRNMARAYRQSFPTHRIEDRVMLESCTIVGSPDLIAQMLDKLMDNAIDFTPAGAAITLALDADTRACRLSVANQGPALPAELDGRLFESLVSGRHSSNGRPHLGFGLYIARLIADFHGGQLSAGNLDDGSGVILTLDLPRY